MNLRLGAEALTIQEDEIFTEKIDRGRAAVQVTTNKKEN